MCFDSAAPFSFSTVVFFGDGISTATSIFTVFVICYLPSVNNPHTICMRKLVEIKKLPTSIRLCTRFHCNTRRNELQIGKVIIHLQRQLRIENAYRVVSI